MGKYGHWSFDKSRDYYDRASTYGSWDHKVEETIVYNYRNAATAPA